MRYEDMEQQIHADFARVHWAEATALVESVLAHARPDDHALVWRKMLDGVRGDIAHLRRLTPKTTESLERIYRLLGPAADAAAETPPA